ncbi:MAG: hypothetical protein RSC93_03140 [Erysipelotrichaceae bacterium]
MNYLKECESIVDFVRSRNCNGETGRNFEVFVTYLYGAYIEIKNEHNTKLYYEGIFPVKNKEDIDSILVNKAFCKAYDRIRIQITCINKNGLTAKCKSLANYRHAVTIIYCRDKETKRPHNLNSKIEFTNLYEIVSFLQVEQVKKNQKERFEFIDLLFEKMLNTMQVDKNCMLNHYQLADKKAEILKGYF